jgi:hypothetical protein
MNLGQFTIPSRLENFSDLVKLGLNVSNIRKYLKSLGFIVSNISHRQSDDKVFDERYPTKWGFRVGVNVGTKRPSESIEALTGIINELIKPSSKKIYNTPHKGTESSAGEPNISAQKPGNEDTGVQVAPFTPCIPCTPNHSAGVPILTAEKTGYGDIVLPTTPFTPCIQDPELPDYKCKGVFTDLSGTERLTQATHNIRQYKDESVSVRDSLGITSSCVGVLFRKKKVGVPDEISATIHLGTGDDVGFHRIVSSRCDKSERVPNTEIDSCRECYNFYRTIIRKPLTTSSKSSGNNKDAVLIGKQSEEIFRFYFQTLTLTCTNKYQISS